MLSYTFYSQYMANKPLEYSTLIFIATNIIFTLLDFLSYFQYYLNTKGLYSIMYRAHIEFILLFKGGKIDQLEMLKLKLFPWNARFMSQCLAWVILKFQTILKQNRQIELKWKKVISKLQYFPAWTIKIS